MISEDRIKTAFLMAMQDEFKDRLGEQVGERIIKERFTKKPRKKALKEYRQSEEFHQEKRARMLALSQDETSEYWLLIHRPQDHPQIAKMWETHRDLILMLAEEKGDFSVKAFYRALSARQRAASLEKQLVKSGLIKPGREPAEDIVVRQAARTIADRIGRYLAHNEILIEAGGSSGKGKHKRSVRNPLTIRTFDNLVSRLRSCKDATLQKFARIDSLSDHIEETWYALYPALRDADDETARRVVKLSGKEARGRCREEVMRLLTPETIAAYLKENPRYADIAAIKEEDFRISVQLADYLENGMPSDYTRLYPRARRMKRSFILHIGPTNSGKTHDAMEDLMRSETGTYLGPLRLMAYEQYETMADAGIDCQMLTGEEQIGDPEAMHVASTIEMADLRTEYEVAVIDEAQMISEFERGSAWTAAILGVCAKRVHVCAAPEAVEVVQRLIDSCGDSCEIVWHERMVPIRPEKHSFRFPKDVEKGDALVVFSRRSVHEIAKALQDKGILCSVIYGALPYDVRHEEVRKFREGETDVVVATDAIGMGMNLPIRRVVFIEQEKFDGEKRRPLLPQEIRQIAGRAGRFGLYEVGFYTTVGDVEELASEYERKVDPIRDAVIGLPGEILKFDARISRILMKWAEIPVQEGYIKMTVDREIHLAERLETISDNKELIYDFISFKFDEEEPTILYLWEECFARVLDGETLDDMDIEPYTDEFTMAGLELAYRQYDLLYSCVRYVNPESPRLEEIQEERKRITKKLMKLLEEQGFEGRRCKRCGRSLPMGYRYSLCENCFEKRRYARKHRRN
ncbi:MAG: DEAD/DEAH box helicase [Lachnospiraceae bacterium]|nr:DEAD/DEAH box helicase [Lachnospiraceae bacterium]